MPRIRQKPRILDPRGWPQAPPSTQRRRQKPHVRGPGVGHKHRGHAEKTAKPTNLRPKGWPRMPGASREETENPRILDPRGWPQSPGARREDNENRESWTQRVGRKRRGAHREYSENRESETQGAGHEHHPQAEKKPKTKHLRPKGLATNTTHRLRRSQKPSILDPGLATSTARTPRRQQTPRRQRKPRILDQRGWPQAPGARRQNSENRES